MINQVLLTDNGQKKRTRSTQQSPPLAPSLPKNDLDSPTELPKDLLDSPPLQLSPTPSFQPSSNLDSFNDDDLPPSLYEESKVYLVY